MSTVVTVQSAENPELTGSIPALCTISFVDSELCWVGRSMENIKLQAWGHSQFDAFTGSQCHW